MSKAFDPSNAALHLFLIRGLLARLFGRSQSLPQSQTCDPGRAFELAGYGRGADLAMLPTSQNDRPH